MSCDFIYHIINECTILSSLLRGNCMALCLYLIEFSRLQAVRTFHKFDLKRESKCTQWKLVTFNTRTIRIIISNAAYYGRGCLYAIRILSPMPNLPIQRHIKCWRKCQRNYFILNIFMVSLVPSSSSSSSPPSLKTPSVSVEISSNNTINYLRFKWKILIFR